jgi:hypothetical protein
MVELIGAATPNYCCGIEGSSKIMDKMGMFQSSVLLIAIIAALDMFFITTKLQIERMFNFFLFFFTKLEFRQIYPVLFHNWGIEL